MPFLLLPTAKSDEETILMAKYNKLRKKKKALHEMTSPKPEPEKVNPLKRQLDPKDAKELAKKLLNSGKVSIPQKPLVEKTIFKRSRILEKKIFSGRMEATPIHSSEFGSFPQLSDSPSSIQFEPFTPTYSNESSSDDKEMSSSPSSTHSPRNYRKSFAPMDINSPFDYKKGNSSPYNSPTNPKRGPTIYVHGHSLKEEILKEAFEKFGKTLSIKIKSSSTGFVTFEKTESAEAAIAGINNSGSDDYGFEVSFARRQPSLPQMINDASASATWTTLASSQSQKGTHRDQREQLTYEHVEM